MSQHTPTKPRFSISVTLQFTIQLLCVVAILAGIAYSGKFPSTELIAGAFIFVFMWTPRGRAFLLEFAPFLFLLLTYKQLRNYADDLGPQQINVENMIAWERALFGGGLPGHFVQTHLWGQPYTPILDAISNTLYLFHFLSPLVIAVLLWQKQRSLYWTYAAGLILLSYAAFATYILFPAAPPWWATQHGFLPHDPITLDHFVISGATVAKGANPVAAMPSLHAAYPSYIALVVISVWGKKALPIILLPLSVIFATIYLGHHYVIDAAAGALYAGVAFSLVFVGVRKAVIVYMPVKWAQEYTPRLHNSPR